MKNYHECREIAENRLTDSNIIINRAYRLGEDFVFDNKDEEYIGKLPVVVRSFNGECMALWHYLNEFDMYLDDMIEIPLEGDSRFEYDCIGKPIDINDKNIKWKNTVLTPEEAERRKAEYVEEMAKKGVKIGE